MKRESKLILEQISVTKMKVENSEINSKSSKPNGDYPSFRKHHPYAKSSWPVTNGPTNTALGGSYREVYCQTDPAGNMGPDCPINVSAIYETFYLRKRSANGILVVLLVPCIFPLCNSRS